MKKIKITCLLSMMFLLLLTGQAQADVQGIDVSKWQGTIDWETVRNHAGFAIIKAGGADKGLYIDSEFDRNRNETRRLGIPRGYYYFAGGGDPVLEAEHFASITGELQPGEVVALDMETDTPDPVAYSLKFLEKTEQLLGVKPMLYTNMNRVWGYDWKPVADRGYPLWGAIYDQDQAVFPDAGAWPELAMKQFTSKGTIPGITGHLVDVNVIKGDLSSFQLLGKFGEMPKGQDEKPVEKPRQPKPGYMGGEGDGRVNPLDDPYILVSATESEDATEEGQNDESGSSLETGSESGDYSASGDSAQPENSFGEALGSLIGRLLFGSSK